MNRFRPFAAIAVAFAAAIAAQGQDPFGGDPFGGAPGDPFGGAAAPPSAATPPGAPAPGAATPAVQPPTPAAPEHPLVTAIRETNPTTPAQLMRAVTVALDVRDYAAAKNFLQHLRTAAADVASLAALVREFGTAAVVRLGSTPELAPEGRQFAVAAMQAADAEVRDAARLQRLAAQVSDPSLSVKRAAIRELQQAGAAAVAPLLHVLADASRGDAQADAQMALEYLGQPAVEPLLAALEAPDPALRARVAEALGSLRAKAATDLLVGPATNPLEDPAVQEAAARALQQIVGSRPHPLDAYEFLVARINALLDGELPRTPDLEGAIELWQWEPTQSAPTPRRYAAEEAGAVLAARLAENLYVLVQNDPRLARHLDQARRLYLTALLQAAKVQAGLHLPLPRGEDTAHARAAALGAAAVEDALYDALQRDRVAAAIGAAEVLGDIGSPALAQSGVAQPAPLIAALSHKNQRLRFVASEAIAKLDPLHPYPNSSRYVNTLARIVRTEALPRVVVADPRGHIAHTLAGMLQRMGFEAEAAFTGRQAYDAATRHPDTAFLLLSDALNDPPVDQLVQLLRQDLRTANLPIGVMYRIDIEPILYANHTRDQLAAATLADDPVPGLYYRQDRMLAAQRIAQGDPLTIALPNVSSAATLDWAVRRLSALAKSDFITSPERLLYAQIALDALGRYAADPVTYAFYDVASVQDALVKAMDQTELAPFAARALGMLGTARAQRTLADVASQTGRPLAVRQAAAAAFRAAVAREHLQLTTQEILLQYDRYNLSAHLDRETQAVLGHVLDTLEGTVEEPPPSTPADVQEPSPAS